MVANVVGMSLHADGGLMATKPYAAGGAYINRMSDYCGQCPYRPGERVGERACPYTGGYWWFLHRDERYLAGGARVSIAVPWWVPWWATPYLTVYSIALRRIDDMLTR